MIEGEGRFLISNQYFSLGHESSLKYHSQMFVCFFYCPGKFWLDGYFIVVLEMSSYKFLSVPAYSDFPQKEFHYFFSILKCER